MNIRIYYLFLLVMVLFQGCEFIGGVFRTGIAVGVIIVLLVIGLVIYIVARIRRS